MNFLEIIILIDFFVNIQPFVSRRKLGVTDEYFKRNENHSEIITSQLEIKEIEKCVQDDIGMWVNVSHIFNTGLVISKCGHPIFLMYPTCTITELLHPEDVRKLYMAYSQSCNLEKYTFNLTRQGYPFVEGIVEFTPGEKKNAYYGPTKLHNISEPIIPSVSFGHFANQKNTYPIKIGSILEKAREPGQELILSLFSTAPMTFRFSKCGEILSNFPDTLQRPIIITGAIIDALEELQNRDCGTWWYKGIIDVEIDTGKVGAGGILKFKLIENKSVENTKRSSLIPKKHIVAGMFCFFMVSGFLIIFIHIIKKKCEKRSVVPTSE